MTTILRGRPALLILLNILLAATTLTAQANDTRKNVKMVVTAAIVSDKGMAVYDDMARYFSKRLGWNVEIVSGLSYQEADAMLDKGIIQVGYICGLPYIHKFAQKRYELLAVPIMAKQEGRFRDTKGYQDIPGKYYSYTIVHKDSSLNTWKDLKGKTYAFSDINSNSGYNMPRYKLLQLGAKSWEDYFSKVVVSGSHEESIRLVARGMVDASSVDSLVLDYDRSIGDPDALNVRIIEHLHPGGAGIPPVVFSRQADPAIKKSLQQVFLTMHEDPEGREILDKALTSRFAPPQDSNYDDIRMMERAARKAGFKDFKE